MLKGLPRNIAGHHVFRGCFFLVWLMKYTLWYVDRSGAAMFGNVYGVVLARRFCVFIRVE